MLAGTVAVSFGIPIGLAVAKILFDVEGIPTSALIATSVLGCLYFPMAFLAVATLDTIAAANPLVIVPSMLRVPLEYLVTVVLFAVVFGFRIASRVAMARLFPDGLTTQSIGSLLGFLGSMALASFLALYLIIVAVHTLGLIYVTRKEKLAWLG